MEFQAWPKIIRYENKQTPIFTEKLDGTNACIIITEANELACQSRTRIITPENDNFNFAKWAYSNKEELLKLGPGYHYGEWWGLGIQRNYGLTEKRFSLFNSRQWGVHNSNMPSCVSVVPILPANTVEEARQFLLHNGSVAAPGWTNPEGAIMYEPDTKSYFKIIIDK